MTLLRKFGVLLSVLALMVVLNLGTALWAVSILQREVSVYLNSISLVLGGLNRIKRDLGDLAVMLPADVTGDPRPWMTQQAGDTPEEELRRFRDIAAQVNAQMLRLEESGTFSARSGISARQNLVERIDTALKQAGVWFTARERDSGIAARQGLFDLHELIERNESKILGDAQSAVMHSRDIRIRVISSMLIALVVTIAVAALGMALMHRWVVRPVSELRAAAGRFAGGEFGHRVPVQGRDELAMLSAEVNQMAGMISSMQEERVERERLAAVGEMVRRVAHNLRNPLAGIRSLAELTKGDLQPGDPAQENQDRIISTVDRFECWLGEMLRATSPLVVSPYPMRVGPWLKAVLAPLEPLATSKRIQLRLDVAKAPEEATFDGSHLEHAVVAIVTNAIQAAPAGTPITITGTDSGSHWELEIRDCGPGVPPELVEKIFRPYFTTKRDGTGIGLAVAKQIAEQHGGRLLVKNGPPASESEPGKGPGAIFTLRLPLQGVIGGAAAANSGHGGGSGGQNPDSGRRSESPVLHPADA